MSDKVSSAEPQPPKHWDYESEVPDGIRIGVAVSGGGVRSAAFGLGALQSLQQGGLLERTHYLSAVSGGSYIAAAYVSTMAESGTSALARASAPGQRAPWSPGSPEEQRLYKNLGYLARGFQGRAWFFANVVYGALMNLLPLLCGSFLVGRLLGTLVYSRLHPDLERGALNRTALTSTIVLTVGLLVATSLPVLLRRLRKGDELRDRNGAYGRTVSVATALLWAAVGCVMVGVVLPVSALVVHLTMDLAGLLDQPLSGYAWYLARFATGAGLTLVSLLLGGLAVLVLRTGRLHLVALVLASISGPLLLMTPAILAIESSALRGWSTPRDLGLLAGCLAVLALFGFYIHNRRYSMHDFYRERLAEAFFLERTWNPDPAPGKPEMEATSLPYSKRIKLSQHHQVRPGVPTLLIGAAVNASDTSVGFGSGAAPYVFAPDKCGSNDLDWTDTAELEKPQAEDGSDLTLPAMVAISGAALSPVMGRLTVSSFRFLLALLNVRLGVWVRQRTAPGENPQRATRPWERLDRRLSENRVYAAAKRGWLEPGALYVLREGLGQTSLKGRFVYVTDGGHWENLGLYELARRRCTHIVVFDASNNPQSALADFARCCQLMFSRLGLTIRIDPTLWDRLESGDIDEAQPVAVGAIVYPDGAAPGVLVYARCTLWRDAPPELKLYGRLDGKFPRHSTGNQFLTADQFDAYRRLGVEVGARAGVALDARLTDPDLDESRSGRPDDDVAPRFAVVS